MHTQFRFSDMHVHTNPFFTHPVQISSPCMCMFVHVELSESSIRLYIVCMCILIPRQNVPSGMHVHNTSPNSERTNIGYTPWHIYSTCTCITAVMHMHVRVMHMHVLHGIPRASFILDVRYPGMHMH